MSMIRSAKLALIALSVLTCQSVSHAETPAGKQAGHFELTEVNTNNIIVSGRPTQGRNISERDLDCLARNIYHESRGEPEEGKVAVGMVTINRASDKRFPSTVCGVVNQRTKSTCQFSWRCNSVSPPRSSDHIWLECRRIARELLERPNSYTRLWQKYRSALYFHEFRVRPSWAAKKQQLARIGAHMFYGDRRART